MITATLQLMNEGDKDGKPYKKVFDDEKAMNKWLNDQSGHPWLSIRLIKVEKTDVDSNPESKKGI